MFRVFLNYQDANSRQLESKISTPGVPLFCEGTLQLLAQVPFKVNISKKIFCKSWSLGQVYTIKFHFFLTEILQPIQQPLFINDINGRFFEEGIFRGSAPAHETVSQLMSITKYYISRLRVLMGDCSFHFCLLHTVIAIWRGIFWLKWQGKKISSKETSRGH